MLTRFWCLCHKIEIQFLNQLFLVECVWSFSWILIRNVNTLKLFNFHNFTTAYLRWPWSNNGEIHLTFVFNLKVWQKCRFHVLNFGLYPNTSCCLFSASRHLANDDFHTTQWRKHNNLSSLSIYRQSRISSCLHTF